MKKLTFTALMLLAQMNCGIANASTAYVKCSSDTIKTVAEQYVQNVPHYSSGYQFQNVSFFQSHWQGKTYCTATFTRSTDSCDPYLYRMISVDVFDNHVIDDRYSDSAWCSY